MADEVEATSSHFYGNMPITHFAQDGKNFADLCWRVFMGHQEVNEPSEGEAQLFSAGSWSKVATAALRIPIWADNKGWAKTNKGHVISKEPTSRKMNPLIADFKKAHGRLPAIGDTITVTSNSEIFVPTTFEPGENRLYTGKYSASMNAVLTREQWEDIPDSQKNAQNCIYEILNTTDISFTAKAKEGASTAPSGRFKTEGW